MSPRWVRSAALLLLGVLASAPVALGDDGDDAQRPITVTPRLERMRKVVKDVETALAMALAQAPRDEGLVRTLEGALEESRELCRPVTFEQLTEEERVTLTEEFRRSERGPARGPAPLNEWQRRVLDRGFEGVDLDDEEREQATEIVSDWLRATQAARMDDSKRVSDLKRERDDRLQQALGRKQAQRVINNLNSLSSRRF